MAPMTLCQMEPHPEPGTVGLSTHRLSFVSPPFHRIVRMERYGCEKRANISRLCVFSRLTQRRELFRLFEAESTESSLKTIYIYMYI